MLHQKNRGGGFTIVELVIYSALLLVFLLVLTQIFFSVLDVQLESEATSAVTQDGRYIVLRLIYDVSRATAMTTPAALGQQTSNLVLTIGGTTYTYSVTGGILSLNDGTTTQRLNSVGTTISNPTFRRLGNVSGKNSVKFAFTVTSTGLRSIGNEVQDFASTVGLR